MPGSQPGDLRAYYEAEGATDYQSRLYASGDWIHQRLRSIVFRELQTHCRDGMRLLDAGCAEGMYMGAVPQLRYAVGIDISYAKLKRGRGRVNGSHVWFVHADMEQMPFAPASFDLALCVEVLEHVPDVTRALTGLYTLIRPGGKLIVSVPTEKNELFAADKMLRKWWEKSGHLHSFDRDEFSDLLRHCGFAIIKQERIDILGGKLRHIIVSSWPWRAVRKLWRHAGNSRTPVKKEHCEAVGRLPIAVRFWQRLDTCLCRIPGLGKWGSMEVWVCSRE